MTAKYEHIATITLDSSASSVTFSSIPQGYRDLELVIDAVTIGGAADMDVFLNGNTNRTGGDYQRVVASGNGSGTFSPSGANARITYYASVSTTPSNQIVQFLDYSATDKHKTYLARCNRADSGTDMTALRFASTSAITSIELDPDARTFSAGSTFDLYGIVGGA